MIAKTCPKCNRQTMSGPYHRPADDLSRERNVLVCLDCGYTEEKRCMRPASKVKTRDTPFGRLESFCVCVLPEGHDGEHRDALAL